MMSYSASIVNANQRIKLGMGIKVICINKDTIYDKFPLTIGKIYEVYEKRYHGNDLQAITVFNDNGVLFSYCANNFMIVEEWREQQLNKIL